MLTLSHYSYSLCVGTKISSITEERLSRSRRYIFTYMYALIFLFLVKLIHRQWPSEDCEDNDRVEILPRRWLCDNVTPQGPCVWSCVWWIVLLMKSLIKKFCFVCLSFVSLLSSWLCNLSFIGDIGRVNVDSIYQFLE